MSNYTPKQLKAIAHEMKRSNSMVQLSVWPNATFKKNDTGEVYEKSCMQMVINMEKDKKQDTADRRRNGDQKQNVSKGIKKTSNAQYQD